MQRNDTVSKLGCGFITIVLIVSTIWAINTADDSTVWFIIATVVSIICFISLFVGSNVKSKNKTDYNHLIKLANDELVNLKLEENTKRNILSSYIKCLEISKEIEKEQLSIDKLRTKKQKKYKELLYEKEEIVKDLNNKLNSSEYDSYDNIEDYTLNKYMKVCDAFEKLDQSKKVAYLLPNQNDLNIKVTKSVFGFIKSRNNVPAFQIPQTKETVYFYPKFVIVSQSEYKFHVFPIENITIKGALWSVGWIKADEVPNDCFNVRYKYTYANKDGKPDLRYNYNPKLAYPKYCSIHFSFLKGYLLISNKTVSVELAKTLTEYLKLFNSNNQSLIDFNEEGNPDSISYKTKELKNVLKNVNELINITKELSKTSLLTNVVENKQLNSSNNLDELIGLESVKKEVDTMVNFVKMQQIRQKQGLKTSDISYHCVFTGNPGTGKTTVARILANIYKEIGVLKQGHLVETDRSGLIAEYTGQTAIKTNRIIDSALDGVLFIDEAYSLLLSQDDTFGKEAIATLLKRMEDDRDRLVVILAGYSDEMKRFIESNPGLQSRFNRYIDFPDYTPDELLQIFNSYVERGDYKLTEEAKEYAKQLFDNCNKTNDIRFGNARFVRNVFEKTIENQSNRLSVVKNPTKQQLREIIPDDFLEE